VLPILADLMPVIQWRLDVTEEIDAPLFSSTGRVALREETVAALVDDIEGAMLEAGELERGPFSMRIDSENAPAQYSLRRIRAAALIVRRRAIFTASAGGRISGGNTWLWPMELLCVTVSGTS